MVFWPVLLSQDVSNLCQEHPESFAETPNSKCLYSTPASLTAWCCAAPLPGLSPTNITASELICPIRFPLKAGMATGRDNAMNQQPGPPLCRNITRTACHHQSLVGWGGQQSRAANIAIVASSSSSRRSSAKGAPCIFWSTTSSR